MAGWAKLRQLADAECQQAIEEGKDEAAVDALRQRLITLNASDESEANNQAVAAVMDELQALPVRDDFAYEEPSELDAIKAAREGQSQRWALSLDDDALLDRMYGAWLGRCAGCALGKPVETFMCARDGLSSRQRLREYVQGTGEGEWPIRDYVRERSNAEQRTGRTDCAASTREHIAFMETDDDIRYTVIGQLVLQKYGRAFTTLDVMGTWMKYLPFHFVCTAETQAYRNIVARYGRSWVDKAKEAEAIDIDWVRRYQNPYREWIGAQIRADSWGYAAPGDPALAAEFAWRDARFTHVKNGIYGEMFVAAMIAAAFATDDVDAIIESGLAEIPARSRLYHEMRQTIDICSRHDRDAERFEAVFDDIEALLGHYHAVHTNNNAAVVVASLLMAGGDLGKAITLAVMGGWDTDCNGATAGSIIGAMVGAQQLPGHWIDRLNDTLYSAVIGYHPIAISECAKRSLDIAKQVREAQA